MVNDSDTPKSDAALGRALGISAPMVHKLKGRGMPSHSIAKAKEWREANLNPAQRQRSPSGERPKLRVANDETFDQARTRKEIADADRAEMEAAKMRGELVSAEDVARQWAVEASRQREAWLQFAERIAPLLEMRPLAFIRQTVDAEVRQILSGLSA